MSRIVILRRRRDGIPKNTMDDGTYHKKIIIA
jgi:hypothetical protein